MKTLSITIILLLGSLYVYPQNMLSKTIGKSTNMEQASRQMGQKANFDGRDNDCDGMLDKENVPKIVFEVIELEPVVIEWAFDNQEQENLFRNDLKIVTARDHASGMATGKRQHKPITITKELSTQTMQTYGIIVENENGEKVIALIPENLWLNIEAESINTNNSMPNRISMNVTVPKQTQGATFGEKVNQGLQKKEMNTDSKELFPVSLTRQMVKVAPQTYKVEGTIQIEGKTYSISSVLKTKHDTVKNSINNVR